MMRIALNWLTVEVIITIIISTGHIMAVNSLFNILSLFQVSIFSLICSSSSIQNRSRDNSIKRNTLTVKESFMV